MAKANTHTQSKKSSSKKKSPDMPNGESVLKTGGRQLRTLDDIALANEEVFDAIEHGRCSPKQMEQMNTVIKSQIKVKLEIPMQALKLLRDLRKAGMLDIELTPGFLDANPALKSLVAGKA